jgi:predicted nucleic acid-binding protein
MSLQKVIFDNTVFNFFVRIESANLFHITKSIITDSVLVPSKVLEELESLGSLDENYMQKILYWTDQIKQNYFYQFCSSYDSIVLDFLSGKIDKGEADAIAQSLKTGVSIFITDDKNCLEFIEDNYSHIKSYSTFFLISLADVHGLLPDYEKTVAEYHKIIGFNSFRKITKKLHLQKIRYEYIEAMKYLGINKDKKLISQKTSFLTILKNSQIRNNTNYQSSSTPNLPL